MSARVVLAALAVGVGAAGGQAAEYFVSQAGNNAWPGTAAQPWRTLQYAADQVGPGDRVTTQPGTYAGFYLDTSGTASAPIEFFAEPGVTIDQPNPVRPQHGINLENASHVVIDGFAVTGMERAGVRSVGAGGDELASFVTIRNVRSYDNGYWGILTGFVDDLVIENNETSGSVNEHGIYVSNSGDRPVIRNNLSWGNHANGIHMNGDASLGGDGIISGAVVSGNVIFDNGLGGGSGINMDGVQGSRIENNLLYNNHASGISLYRIDGGGPSMGNVVVNNTVHQASDGRWALNIQSGSTGNTAFNNILVSEHSFRGAVDISAGSLSGFASDYNVVISRFTTDGGNSVLSLGEWQNATGNDLHSQIATAAELFVNPAAGNYHLLQTADAVDAGTALQAPAFDLDDRPRPVGAAFDIGAYEWGPTTLPGDFNSDGSVDAADYATWRKTNGTPEGYQQWRENFGATNGATSTNGTSAPEPLALALLVIGALLVAARCVRPFPVRRKVPAILPQAAKARR